MKKLDSKAIKCIFIGYCTNFKAYKLFNPSTHKVFASRYVVFHEQIDDGDCNKGNEEWHMPLLVEYRSDETRENHEKQQQQQQKGRIK